MTQPARPARPAAPEQDEFDKIDDEWLLLKNHLIEIKESIENRQNEELEEAKSNVEAFKRVNQELQNDIDRLEEEKDRLQSENDTLQDKNEKLEEHNKTIQKRIDELQKQIDELIAVPAPASPNRPATLQKWIFCQYLLQIDRSKKYYNTFRNKWVGVMMVAQRIGGVFLEDIDDINNRSIKSLEGMTDVLQDIYERYRHDEIKAALNYLNKAKEEFPNA